MDKPKIFRISTFNTRNPSEDFDNYQVEIDGELDRTNTSDGQFKGSGGIIVEGSTIFIHQISTGTGLANSWSVISEPNVTAVTQQWGGLSGERITIAKFKESREFTFHFHGGTKGCSKGSVIVYIDGDQIVNDLGRAISLYKENSFIGKGKKIEVLISGTCDRPDSFFKGSISLAK